MLKQITARSLKNTPEGETLYYRLHNAMLGMPGMKVTFYQYFESVGRWVLDGGWSGPFFKVFLHHVATDASQWFQPLLEQATTAVEINGEAQNLTGFVVRINSEDGRTVLILANEPGAPRRWNAQEKEIHPVLRHPVQVGVTKWEQVVELGWVEKDPVLQAILATLGVDVFRQIAEWQLAIHDPTRIVGETAIGAVVLDNGQFDKLAEVLASLGGMVFTPEEIKLLQWSGFLLSPHTKDGLAV